MFVKIYFLVKKLDLFKKYFYKTISSLLFLGFIQENKYVFASTGTPQLVTGTYNLFVAGTTWLLILIPVGAGAVLGYHALMKSLSDDDTVIADKNKKMKNVLIGAAIAETASGIVRVVLGFYQ